MSRSSLPRPWWLRRSAAALLLAAAPLTMAGACEQEAEVPGLEEGEGEGGEGEGGEGGEGDD